LRQATLRTFFLQLSWGKSLGTIKKGSTLGLRCADVLFIVRNDNKIIQPVITHDLLNGFSEGDVIRFGHKEIFLGMASCGENVETAELLCVDAFK
jgi:hypothetical protein